MIAQGHDKSFRRLLIDTCTDLEMLFKLQAGALALVEVGPNDRCTVDFGSGGRVTYLLAKSALFNAVRALRILEHAAAGVGIPRDRRKKIVKMLQAYRQVRDANEHGLDPTKKMNPYVLSSHDQFGTKLDQISMVIIGNDILIGEVNLRNLYGEFSTLRAELMAAEIKEEGHNSQG